MPWDDDAGARTADLYDWQAAMAAADALRLVHDAVADDGCLQPDIAAEVICEHHEDWTVIVGTSAELVSAKHRELDSGAWTTVNQLVTKGGLRHLFDRWLSLNKLPGLRLVTCAGLKSGECAEVDEVARLLRDQAQGVELSQESLALIAKTLQKVAKELLCADGAELPGHLTGPVKSKWVDLAEDDARIETLRAFLSRLHIDKERPSRKHVAHAAPSMYMAPVLKQMRKGEVPAGAAWEAVLDLFRARMRSAGPIPGGMLPLINAAAGGSAVGTTAESQNRELARRRITIADIEIAIRLAIDNLEAYLPVSKVVYQSPLSVKMDIGRCNDTSIARAEDLRSEYLRYYRDRDETAPGEMAKRRAVNRWLLKVADEETATIPNRSNAWGPELWRALSDRLVDGYAADDSDPDAIQLDGDLALGGVCDLVHKCKVWFSPAFDVKAELARRRAQLRGAM
ncbi:hypothetical protein [Pseudonocardia ailaonensis]|uniref:hypothetical protein n=1 Tax=Pseudonocardia ailaonensis TaxID=367279 RepID=UPI0031D61D56